MLKWTASAFAMAAAMQFGIASAQNTVNGAATPPEPIVADSATDRAGPLQKAEDATRDSVRDSRENHQVQGVQDELQGSRQDPTGEEGTQREARFAPNANDAQMNDHVRSATSNLDIDDATRSRYRWHKGEWWFKTKSGNWKYHRDGKWQDFDPTTYRAMNSGGSMAPGTTNSSGNWVPQGNTNYAQPQQFNTSNGYRQQSYGASRPNYDQYNNGRYNNSGWNNGYNSQSNNGYGYNNGYNNGFGQGYNPGTDRYQGYGPTGQPYSISGNQYRGGVVGSQIGGQLGGNTGAIIGGALGAKAAK